MQQHSFLATKLYIPPLRPELVSRPRLIERLDAGLPTRGGLPRTRDAWSRALTLISAPAGFGKTTLVSEWVQAMGAATSSIAVAWLSLDEGDNDPARFLAYLIVALRTIKANMARGVLSELQVTQAPPAEDVLTVLINEIVAIPERIILVLDDYHLIEAQPVNDALGFLLEHLPPQMHLVIATREDPYLPLARLRAQGQLTEVRASDLRFTSSEAAEFLNRVMGLDLSAEDVAALERRTEGWIAGLQLAALSMQGRKDATSLIQSFSGSHRFVLDYLIEEVLEQQTESIQTFLLQTSVLNRLTGSLCDAVRFDVVKAPSTHTGDAVRFGIAESRTDQDDGQAILEMLERANLFIVPLDNERRWYRYHHLFAELLEQRLRSVHPDRVNTLHARAVIWYETHGNLSEAIHHAFAMDDVKTAARLIEKGALEALKRGELKSIFDWVARLSENDLKEHPWLFIYHSWALLATGQVEAVRPRLENTEWLLDAVSDDEKTKRREMLGCIAGLKAQLSIWQRDYPNVFDFANQAWANLSGNNWIRGYCANMVGAAFWGRGDLAASKDAFAEAAAIGKASGTNGLAVSGSCNLAHSLELEGHLQQALKLFRDTFQLAEQDGRVLPVAGFVHNELAKVYYELDELDLAGQHLKEGIRLCQRLPDGRAVSFGHCLLARVQLAKGNFAGVVKSIQKSEQADPSPGTTFDMRGGEYPHVRLWLKEKKLEEVESWLTERSVNVDDVSHFKTKLTYTMHARALIALGREHPDGTYLNDALSLLEELLGMADENGWGSKVIEILALQAVALQERGDTAQAMNRLERALALAEPEGFVRIFVDEGPPMARLLYEAVSRGISPDYARRLLAACPVAELEPTRPPDSQAQESVLIEPLSEREIEVLHLIAEGLTNREIASRLFLSVNTVKAHSRSVYGKLDVHSRTQAIARSQQLGFVPNRPKWT